MRAINAYFASAIVGAVILTVYLLAGSPYPGAGSLFGFILVLTFIVVLPFWAALVALANWLRVTSGTAYLIAGSIFGVLLGSTFMAAMPGQEMLWYYGPILDFGGRWMRIFYYSGAAFAVSGAAACTCYWLVAVRRWPI